MLRHPRRATATTLTTHPPATLAEAATPLEAAASLHSEHTDEDDEDEELDGEEDIAVCCDGDGLLTH